MTGAWDAPRVRVVLIRLLTCRVIASFPVGLINWIAERLPIAPSDRLTCYQPGESRQPMDAGPSLEVPGSLTPFQRTP